jgi:glycosyltransferase involved in cell wall biosynthesis
MERKIAMMAEDKDLVFSLVRPCSYEGTFGPGEDTDREFASEILSVPLVGRPEDPHRTFYGTITFSMKAFKPDIIHAEEEPDSLSALQIQMARRLFAPRAILILHTYQNINRPKGFCVRWVLNRTLAGSDAILCANSEAVQVLKEMRYKGRTEVIPHEGVNTDLFKPAEHTNSLSRPFTILYGGRFVKEKGLDMLIEALSRLNHETRIILAGAGPYRETLERKIGALDLAGRVEFRYTPSSMKHTMPALFAEADVLVLPSLTTPVWKEQYGRILIEAMACRLPVIGSDSGAIPEVVGAGGLIFREGDLDDFISCIERLMESSTLSKEIADRGRTRAVTFFDQQVIARKTGEFYRKMTMTTKTDHHKGRRS